MANKKIRESDNKAQEEFHCEEIDHNEIEIVQVRIAWQISERIVFMQNFF